jgi:predicted Zn-dependent peptidase
MAAGLTPPTLPQFTVAIPEIAVLATNHIRTTILPNGLTVLTERMEHVRSVSMGIWLKTGARHDAPEHNGLSHFVEHMVFKGTTTRSARRISLDTDELGGYLNAFTAQDMVAFHTTVLDTHVTRALNLLADLILNPEFPPAEIERERDVILEEINATQDNPVYLAHDAFIRTLWKGDPISLPIGGTPETLSSFTRDTLVRYAKDHFTGRNMVFVAAGNLQHDDMVAKVQQCFGRAPAGTSLPRGTFPKASAESTLIDKPSEQVQLLIGVPAPPLTDARYFTAHLAAMVLGGGPSSRLFQSVREQRGLAYSITADYMPFHNTGYFSVYCGTSRTRVRPVLDLILQELHCLKTEPVSPSDLRRAKDQVLSNQSIGLETTAARANALGGQFLSFSRAVSMEERQAAIESVTEDQVMLLANALFDSGRMALALVGDIQGLELALGRLDC